MQCSSKEEASPFPPEEPHGVRPPQNPSPAVLQSSYVVFKSCMRSCTWYRNGEKVLAGVRVCVCEYVQGVPFRRCKSPRLCCGKMLWDLGKDQCVSVLCGELLLPTTYQQCNLLKTVCTTQGRASSCIRAAIRCGSPGRLSFPVPLCKAWEILPTGF